MDEVENVLTNWIHQAVWGPGQLRDGLDPARWVAEMFTRWWRAQVADFLGAAEMSAAHVRTELERLGGWKNQQLFGTLEEMTHLDDALGDLRRVLRLDVT